MSQVQMEALDFRYLLLEYYKKLNISETELAVLLIINHLRSQKNAFITPDLLSLKMNLTVEELDSMLVLKDILAHEYLDNKGKNMNSEKELLDNELEKVTGGSGREITVTIEVPMPPLSGPNNIMEVYIDGQFNAAFSRGVDESLEIAKVEIKGKTGTKSVQVKINGFAYKTYIVDFESGTYSEIQ